MKYDITCTYCGHTQIYKPRNDKIPKKPHTKCKKCSKEFNIDIAVSENIPRIPKISKSTKPQSNTNSSISIDQTLISMNDVEQSRHLYKQVICRTDLDIRTRLEAAKALANLKEKQGKINMEEQSEKEVMDKFRQRTTQSLVSKLKESSQKEL